jgi:hypothetical protein
MKSHETPEDFCPSCGSRANAATGVDHEKKPKPEDFSICFACGAINQFDQQLILRTCSQEVLDKLEPSDREKLLFYSNGIRALQRSPHPIPTRG